MAGLGWSENLRQVLWIGEKPPKKKIGREKHNAESSNISAPGLDCIEGDRYRRYCYVL